MRLKISVDDKRASDVSCNYECENSEEKITGNQKIGRKKKTFTGTIEGASRICGSSQSALEGIRRGQEKQASEEGKRDYQKQTDADKEETRRHIEEIARQHSSAIKRNLDAKTSGLLIRLIEDVVAFIVTKFL